LLLVWFYRKTKEFAVKSVLINGKVDPATKTRVDAILKGHNTTASEAIRTLWDYIAETQSLPEFFFDVEQKTPAATRRARKGQLLALSGIVTTPLNILDDEQSLLEALEKRNA
jgi:antitoxin component of RelBE/YafQ-DinJ toxin-antitoxin module